MAPTKKTAKKKKKKTAAKKSTRKKLPNFEAGDVVLVEGKGPFEVVGKERSSVLLLNLRTERKSKAHRGKVTLAPTPGQDALEGKLDPDGWLMQGHQVFRRDMQFDHSHVRAECWYVIDRDGEKSWAFNSYDRVLNKKKAKKSAVREHAISDIDAVYRRLERGDYERLG